MQQSQQRARWSRDSTGSSEGGFRVILRVLIGQIWPSVKHGCLP